MRKPRFTIGLALGALAGLITGFLTAPKSGKETRADIKRKAGDVKDGAENTVRDVKKAADKTVAEATRQANKMVKDAKDKAEDLVEDAKEKAEDLKKRAENAVEGAKSGFTKPPRPR